MFHKVFSLVAVFLVSCALCLHQAAAQKATLLGVNGSVGIYPEWTLPLAGILLEKRLTQKSGVEVGAFYRSIPLRGTVTYSDGSGLREFSFTIYRRYLSVPVLYRLYTPQVVFSAGPVAEMYLGWGQKGDSSVRVNSVEVRPRVRAGFLVKGGKQFTIQDRYVLEPELRVGSYQGFSDVSFGLGLSAKYRF